MPSQYGVCFFEQLSDGRADINIGGAAGVRVAVTGLALSPRL